MSEIEKMYENAGIKKLLYCNICGAREHALGLCAETECEPFYPPFTAKKQIELIKWFIHSEHFSPIRFNAQWVVDDIASYINFLWQVLTPEEKQQVKGILE